MLETLREDLLKRMEDVKNQLAKGFAKSFEDYRELVGLLRGLEEAYQLTLPRENKNG